MRISKITLAASISLLAVAAGPAVAIDVEPVPIYTLQLEDIATEDLQSYHERLSVEAWDARRNGSLHNPRYKRLQRQISRVETELDQRADASEKAQ